MLANLQFGAGLGVGGGRGRGAHDDGIWLGFTNGAKPVAETEARLQLDLWSVACYLFIASLARDAPTDGGAGRRHRAPQRPGDASTWYAVDCTRKVEKQDLLALFSACSDTRSVV